MGGEEKKVTSGWGDKPDERFYYSEVTRIISIINAEAVQCHGVRDNLQPSQ